MMMYSESFNRVHCWNLLIYTLLITLFPVCLTIYAEPVYSSNFCLLTDQELTRFTDYLYYWSRDSVMYPIHSNSDIPVHQGAYFSGFVSTGGHINSMQGSTFAGLPRPGYREQTGRVPFPMNADSLRLVASRGGRWFSTNHYQYTYGLEINRTVATYWRWHTGTPSTMGIESEALGSFSWWYGSPFPIFCDGCLWVKGVVRGRIGIGAEGSIRIVGDLRCEDATVETQWLVPANSINSITLISEADEPPDNDRKAPNTGILIADSWENGHQNGRLFPSDNSQRRDVVITAQIIALRSSFTFENQNDTNDAGICVPGPDERGNIFLHGSIMQYRRGYVHRNTQGGTGYNKIYRYDERWRNRPAPYAIFLFNR